MSFIGYHPAHLKRYPCTGYGRTVGKSDKKQSLVQKVSIQAFAREEDCVGKFSVKYLLQDLFTNEELGCDPENEKPYGIIFKFQYFIEPYHISLELRIFISH